MTVVLRELLGLVVCVLGRLGSGQRQTVAEPVCE